MEREKEWDHRYDDILELPHPVSSRHAAMSMTDRGAQFSPFAALTGFGAAIDETGRLTDVRIEISEEERERLNRKLMYLHQMQPICPKITITYFLPDEKKDGGAYIRATGRLWKIDKLSQQILLENGRRIPMEDLLEIEF